MKKGMILLLGVLLTAILAINGCGGSGGAVGTGGTGTLRVHLVDGSDPDITRVDVNISEVSANIDGQWQVLTNTSQSFNLLDLVLNAAVIGEKVLPTGNYTQIRLKVSSATVTDSTGVHQLVIPSGAQSGIKVNVNFGLNEQEVTDLLLDFNVRESITRQGNGTYLLHPVIRATVMVQSGTVTGTASNTSGLVQGAVVTATYVAGDEYPLGTVVNSTSTLSDGTFKMWALLPGTYNFHVT